MAENRTRRTARRPPNRIRSDEKSAPALVAVIDRQGCVIGTFAGRSAARSFLQGGWA